MSCTGKNVYTAPSTAASTTCGALSGSPATRPLWRSSACVRDSASYATPTDATTPKPPKLSKSSTQHALSSPTPRLSHSTKPKGDDTVSPQGPTAEGPARGPTNGPATVDRCPPPRPALRPPGRTKPARVRPNLYPRPAHPPRTQRPPLARTPAPHTGGAPPWLRARFRVPQLGRD